MTKLQQLADWIAHYEGFYVTQEQAQRQNRHWPTLPQRLNNPGDLIFEGQAGATDHPITGLDGKIRHYAEFDTVDNGWAACYKQLQLDASRGLTLWQEIQKWAPEADANDPNSYFIYVAQHMGAKPDDPLSQVIADA